MKVENAIDFKRVANEKYGEEIKRLKSMVNEFLQPFDLLIFKNNH